MVYSNAFESRVTNLAEELCSLLAFNFTLCRAQQRSRSCKRVAQELAILGNVVDPNEDQIFAPIPADIHFVIVDDSASSD